MDPELTFRTIDLKRHSDVAVRFRADSFVASFGNADRFRKESGVNGEDYLAWLEPRRSATPEGHVHVWLGEEIVGQIEARVLPEEPEVGYVNLIYLAPEYRGRGWAMILDRYIVDFFRNQGCLRARLSVSPTNERALKFYSRTGWTDAGPRPGRPEVHYMERVL